MMPHFSNPEVWKSDPSEDWKAELIKEHIEPIIKNKLQK